jgi:hypothetical protein
MYLTTHLNPRFREDTETGGWVVKYRLSPYPNRNYFVWEATLFVVKILFSVALLLAAAEIAKRSIFFGADFALMAGGCRSRTPSFADRVAVA